MNLENFFGEKVLPIGTVLLNRKRQAICMLALIQGGATLIALDGNRWTDKKAGNTFGASKDELTEIIGTGSNIKEWEIVDLGYKTLAHFVNAQLDFELGAF